MAKIKVEDALALPYRPTAWERAKTDAWYAFQHSPFAALSRLDAAISAATTGKLVELITGRNPGERRLEEARKALEEAERAYMALEPAGRNPNTSVGHIATALLSHLLGYGAGDPTVVFGGPKGILARAGTEAAIGAGADALDQASAMAVGAQERFDPERTLASGVLGGAFGTAVGGVGRLTDALKGSTSLSGGVKRSLEEIAGLLEAPKPLEPSRLEKARRVLPDATSTGRQPISMPDETPSGEPIALPDDASKLSPRDLVPVGGEKVFVDPRVVDAIRTWSEIVEATNRMVAREKIERVKRRIQTDIPKGFRGRTPIESEASDEFKNAIRLPDVDPIEYAKRTGRSLPVPTDGRLRRDAESFPIGLADIIEAMARSVEEARGEAAVRWAPFTHAEGVDTIPYYVTPEGYAYRAGVPVPSRTPSRDQFSRAEAEVASRLARPGERRTVDDQSSGRPPEEYVPEGRPLSRAFVGDGGLKERLERARQHAKLAGDAEAVVAADRALRMIETGAADRAPKRLERLVKRAERPSNGAVQRPEPTRSKQLDDRTDMGRRSALDETEDGERRILLGRLEELNARLMFAGAPDNFRASVSKMVEKPEAYETRDIRAMLKAAEDEIADAERAAQLLRGAGAHVPGNIVDWGVEHTRAVSGLVKYARAKGWARAEKVASSYTPEIGDRRTSPEVDGIAGDASTSASVRGELSPTSTEKWASLNVRLRPADAARRYISERGEDAIKALRALPPAARSAFTKTDKTLAISLRRAVEKGHHGDAIVHAGRMFTPLLEALHRIELRHGQIVTMPEMVERIPRGAMSRLGTNFARALRGETDRPPDAILETTLRRYGLLPNPPRGGGAGGAGGGATGGSVANGTHETLKRGYEGYEVAVITPSSLSRLPLREFGWGGRIPAYSEEIADGMSVVLPDGKSKGAAILRDDIVAEFHRRNARMRKSDIAIGDDALQRVREVADAYIEAARERGVGVSSWWYISRPEHGTSSLVVRDADGRHWALSGEYAIRQAADDATDADVVQVGDGHFAVVMRDANGDPIAIVPAEPAEKGKRLGFEMKRIFEDRVKGEPDDTPVDLWGGGATGVVRRSKTPSNLQKKKSDLSPEDVERFKAFDRERKRLENHINKVRELIKTHKFDHKSSKEFARMASIKLEFEKPGGKKAEYDLKIDDSSAANPKAVNAFIRVLENLAKKLRKVDRGTFYSNPIHVIANALVGMAIEALRIVTNIGLRSGREARQFTMAMWQAYLAARNVRGVDVVRRAAYWTFGTYDAYIREVVRQFGGSKTAMEVVNKLSLDPGNPTVVGETFSEVVARRVNKRVTKWAQIAERLRSAFGDDEKAALAMRGVEKPTTREQIEAMEDARAWFEEEHVHATNSGVDLGYAEDYFPRIFDASAIFRDRDAFLADLELAYRIHIGKEYGRIRRSVLDQIRDGKKRVAIKKSDASLLRDIGIGKPKEVVDITKPPSDRVADVAKARAGALYEVLVYGKVPNPRNPLMRDMYEGQVFASRVFGSDADKILGKWYVKDLDAIGAFYARAITRRSEVAKRFGDRFSKWDNIERDIYNEVGRENGARVLKELVDYVLTVTGYRPSIGAGHSLSQKVRALAAMGTLSDAWLTSIAEPLVFAVQSGDIKAAAVAYARALKMFVTRSSDDEAVKLAQALGVIASDMHDAAMAYRWMVDDMSSMALQAAVNSFFRRTLLERITRVQRASIAKAASIYVTHLAQKAADGDRGAAFILRDLGVENVKAFAGNVSAVAKRLGRPLSNLEDYRLIPPTVRDQFSLAVARMVDYTIMRPTVGQRPKWATTPFGSVIFQLNSYTWAFTRAVHGRYAKLMRAARRGELPKKDLAHLVFLGAMPGFAAMWGIQMLAGELRDVVNAAFAGSDVGERMTTEAKIERAISRMGLFGGADPILNMLIGLRYDRSLAGALQGPVLGTFLPAVEEVVKLALKNSPSTNTQERKAMRAIYDAFLEPSLQFAITPLGVNPFTILLSTIVIPKMGKAAFMNLAGADTSTKKPIRGIIETITGGSRSGGRRRVVSSR